MCLKRQYLGSFVGKVKSVVSYPKTVNVDGLRTEHTTRPHPWSMRGSGCIINVGVYCHRTPRLRVGTVQVRSMESAHGSYGHERLDPKSTGVFPLMVAGPSPPGRGLLYAHRKGYDEDKYVRKVSSLFFVSSRPIPSYCILY